MFEAINPDTVVGPVSNYSNGLVVPAGRMLHISGQVGVDAALVFAEGVEAQTRLAFENIRRIVEAAGGSMDDVVSITLYLKDIGDAKAVSGIRSEIFARPPFPASTMIGHCGFIMPQILVEISAIAAPPSR